ncbi:DUF3293 domain-containing protein [Luteolibacter sp. GHJ8]|uniref:DUF3293 domain-containing protein n=1 Tax=Luteolibacter rhizosphaerae TaxID=2989719 RepID=A0ABT3FWL5_9BACT|nr:DUF3293 domain-containing protein [Luteolibacter rhizosphaerae]MCW1911981.1 DUF3293 domain-containing protein [Luteolibacter rhizosphaerae]
MPFPPEYSSTVFLLVDSPSPLPASFAIITAWNPMDRRTSAEENQAADEDLKSCLENSGVIHFRATGCSPDLVHREEGWAAAISKSDALDLGRQFDQRAIWWIEGDELHLIRCADGHSEMLGSFSSRLV